MSVMGLCYMCNEPGNNSCESCGSIVCDKHYDASTGMCVRCKRGTRTN